MDESVLQDKPLSRSLASARRHSNDADGYKSWLALEIEELRKGKQVAVSGRYRSPDKKPHTNHAPPSVFFAVLEQWRHRFLVGQAQSGTLFLAIH